MQREVVNINSEKKLERKSEKEERRGKRVRSGYVIRRGIYKEERGGRHAPGIQLLSPLSSSSPPTLAIPILILSLSLHLFSSFSG